MQADVHAKDRFGADALRDAIRGKHAEVQQVLPLNAGATSLRPHTLVVQGRILSSHIWPHAPVA
jgi:hypothetical protein